MRALAKPFIFFVERFYPDPFVFAISLTFVVFILCLTLTDATVGETLTAWGEGLEGLMEFIAQIAFTLVSAHALAHTDPVRKLMSTLAGRVRTQNGAYLLVAFVAGVASLFAWSFGLIVGALLARQVAMQARGRRLRLHYPLLVASAYGGYVLWHMGYSSSAALFVATPGHALEDQVGLIPVTETVFTSWNMATALVGLMVVPIICAAMKPKGEDELIEVPDAVIDEYRESLMRMQRELGTGESSAPQAPAPAPRDDSGQAIATPEAGTLAELLDQTRVISLAIGAVLLAYLVTYFAAEGLNLTLNIVNWSFLCLGLLLSQSALHYVKLIANASATVGQIILQYPFYAGIMGMMIATGLVSVIAGWFVAVSTTATLGFFAFLSGGVVNYFIPSGGGQWAVQGPIFIEAARVLGTKPSVVVMGVAYGDQWSNMIQPFWTIPLLAIAGLHMRQIMGYTFVVFIVTFFIFGGGILLSGAVLS